jgi:hypothetical protein
LRWRHAKLLLEDADYILRGDIGTVVELKNILGRVCGEGCRGQKKREQEAVVSGHLAARPRPRGALRWRVRGGT